LKVQGNGDNQWLSSPLSRSIKANFLIYFLGLIVVERFVCFLNDVLINEDEIDELQVEEEGTKKIN
jgi:hypothetical protein